MRLGVDVGGTNTDAVVVDRGRVLGAAKTPTTAPVGDGVKESIVAALEAASLDPSRIKAAMLGTTQVTNAIAERRRTLPTAVLRLCLPANASLKPMVDWPQDLAAEIGHYVYWARGGADHDGSPIAPLDERAVALAAEDMRKNRLRNIAVVGLFSPVNAEHEKRARDIIRDEFPGAEITLSSEIGSLGFIERENAAILNASLGALAREIVAEFEASLLEAGIVAPYFICQNDGSLMSARTAARFPVLMTRSGPTNSMRGASLLTGEKDAIVIDVGGTTSDIGLLVGGAPHLRALSTDTNGVRTNFQTPDVLSLALGGGSIVAFNDGRVTVGPRSVNRHIRTRALAFGGDTLTATDIAVRLGRMRVGDPRLVESFPRERADAARLVINSMIEDGVDRMKLSAGAIRVIAVGGAADLVPEAMKGVAEVMIPEHAFVANAVGAAGGRISAEVDLVISYDASSRADALARARNEASSKAVAAGADPRTVETVDIEEIPLAYMRQGLWRVRAKAAGALLIDEEN